MDAQLGKIPLSILFPYNLHYTTYMFTIRRSYGEVFYAPINTPRNDLVFIYDMKNDHWEKLQNVPNLSMSLYQPDIEFRCSMMIGKNQSK